MIVESVRNNDVLLDRANDCRLKVGNFILAVREWCYTCKGGLPSTIPFDMVEISQWPTARGTFLPRSFSIRVREVEVGQVVASTGGGALREVCQNATSSAVVDAVQAVVAPTTCPLWVWRRQ